MAAAVASHPFTPADATKRCSSAVIALTRPTGADSAAAALAAYSPSSPVAHGDVSRSIRTAASRQGSTTGSNAPSDADGASPGSGPGAGRTAVGVTPIPSVCRPGRGRANRVRAARCGPPSGGQGAGVPPSPARVPVSTYRLQLTPQFGFDAAAAAVPYLADLGVSHVYCSPWLQAAPGSTHGYDVVDHDHVNAELGGEAAHARLLAACRAAGLGIVLDVVPNHAAVSEPESQNAAWWSLLAGGPDSAAARWFDVDWQAQAGRVLVPVLGGPLADVLAAGELRLDGDRVRYYSHEVPIAPGTTVPGDLGATLAAQHYRLAFWRTAGEELNYRRFFDVTTLAGLRVEDPEVFDATHRLILEQVRSGVLDGLRIDHPDGLADPEGYLRRLADATDGIWTVVEKILEPGEDLPATWACAGTTGYDVLNRLTGLFVDPAGEEPLTRLYGELTREPTSYDEVVETCKRLVVDRVLAAEVNRLTALLVAAAPEEGDHTRRALREALVEVLVGFDVYRAYVTPGREPDAAALERVGHAAAAARAARPDLGRDIDVVAELILRGPAELVVRFQQTCGPVMAKGVEDTAFYRYHRLDALNEVGGDPGRFSVGVAGFHEACAAAQRDWPLGMTTLSTHDTKRSEDVRARLVLLSEDPRGWAGRAARLLALAEPHAVGVDRNAQYLLLQTLVGAWPLPADRAVAYLEKASREAKQRTSWTDPDSAYDEALAGLVRAVLADEGFVGVLTGYVGELDPAARTVGLAQKLIQLTMPGVPDVYQGTELRALSLVDPDNRRPVDYAERARQLGLGEKADGKLRVTTAALRLRREHPEWFGADATYAPLDAGNRALAFTRAGAVVVVAPVRALAVQRNGYGDAAVDLPPGRWTDRLGGGTWSGRVPLADLLGGTLPVALLVRD